MRPDTHRPYAEYSEGISTWNDAQYNLAMVACADRSCSPEDWLTQHFQDFHQWAKNDLDSHQLIEQAAANDRDALQEMLRRMQASAMETPQA